MVALWFPVNISAAEKSDLSYSLGLSARFSANAGITVRMCGWKSSLRLWVCSTACMPILPDSRLVHSTNRIDRFLRQS